MNVDVNESPDRLTITQRFTLGYKLQRLFLLLLLGVLLPTYALCFSGTDATLTCAREAGAGIVCTDRLNWLGAFQHAWRYERVEQAYVPGNSPYLHLKTADGFARFSSIHQDRYTRFADPINAFIQDPAAGAVVMSDPINVEVVFISSAILLAAIYRCLSIPTRTGLITIFDLRRNHVWLHREGFWRAQIHTVPLTDVVEAAVYGDAPVRVLLITARKSLQLCWYGSFWAAVPAAEARELVRRINAWLPYDQRRAPRSQPGPDPADVIEIADPDLAYLLGYADSNAAVTYDHRMHLRLDRLSATAEQKHRIRGALAPRPSRAAWPPAVLARELAVLCQVDVNEALDAAAPGQRAALVRLLGLQRP